MAFSMPDPALSHDLPFTADAFLRTLREAREIVSMNEEDATDPDFFPDQQLEAKHAAFGQKRVIGLFAHLIGDTTETEEVNAADRAWETEGWVA